MRGRSGARANQLALQDAVTRMIVDRGLALGDPLPTEHELMDELAVSRHPLREAMKALEARGIVDIRHGYGTYVGGNALSGLEAGLAFRGALSVKGDRSDIRQLLEVREALEYGLVDRVLTVWDGADLAPLEAAVARMEVEADAGRYAPGPDWSFHETLYRPLDNAMVLDLIRVFWQVFHTLDDDLPRGGDTPAVAAQRHRAMLDALATGDPAALRTAVRDHFHGIRARIGPGVASG